MMAWNVYSFVPYPPPSAPLFNLRVYGSGFRFSVQGLGFRGLFGVQTLEFGGEG